MQHLISVVTKLQRLLLENDIITDGISIPNISLMICLDEKIITGAEEGSRTLLLENICDKYNK